ncbi:purine/pyrimidine permease [Bacillus carboniphilus]|uniref:Purine/pyrimidine permease n=1 Tax=Bacillus carboniphilus TaxID=86663 RepID=A0ABY9JXG9_9BACI|nr:purine/pyrimidine permease [Bacillus carboniphilus]WLR43023.1 purine/pyrimidine permease [Bacillus carboniphilus]
MRTILSAIQWAIFMIVGTIVAPIAIADSFDLNSMETAGLLQRTIFVLGLASLLQVLFGHKLPINEGPAGLWWGIFIIYASIGPSLYGSTNETFQALGMGMLSSGLIFIILSLFRLINKLAYFFTPLVTGVYLLLLVFQLSGSFLKGMLGIGYKGTQHVNMIVAILCLTIVVISMLIFRLGNDFFRQYSILFSLLFGWMIFIVFGQSKHVSVPNDLFSFPTLFAFGQPKWDTGIFITSFLITILLLTNLIASIQLVQQVTDRSQNEGRYKQSGFVAGINHIIAGVFSAIGSVPISGAAGFIKTTNIKNRLPFIIGSIIVLLTSFSPILMTVFASLPAPVGYAAIFVIFSSMISLAFDQFAKIEEEKRSHFIIGISLFIGVGLMFTPATAFEKTSPIMTSLLSNGLVLGTLIAIVLECTIKKIIP